MMVSVTVLFEGFVGMGVRGIAHENEVTAWSVFFEHENEAGVTIFIFWHCISLEFEHLPCSAIG